MKKIIFVVMLALVPAFGFAQKFGHVNKSDIIPMMSEYKSAQTELEELKKQYSEELDYMESEYRKKVEDYEKNRETLPDNIRARREQEIVESQQKMQQYFDDCQTNISQRYNELLNTINTKANKAIQAVGEEGGYVCIFDISDGLVPFVSSTLTTDVTEAVKSKLGIK